MAEASVRTSQRERYLSCGNILTLNRVTITCIASLLWILYLQGRTGNVWTQNTAAYCRPLAAPSRKSV